MDGPETMHPSADLGKLLGLVARLRAPDGCPWDRKQDLSSLRAYLLEEAHETADAIDEAFETQQWEPLAEELGDLMFQIAFVGRLAEEHGTFTLQASIDRVFDKMVARHPHVFAPDDAAAEPPPADAAAVARAWGRRKADQQPERSALEGVPRSLPALVAAYRLAQKAAGVGFDWPDVNGALAKVREELEEVEMAITPEATDGTAPSAALREEIGDLLFSVANVARKLGVDPEASLAGCNRKFRRRFAGVEQELRDEGIDLDTADLSRMDAAWNVVKARE